MYSRLRDSMKNPRKSSAINGSKSGPIRDARGRYLPGHAMPGPGRPPLAREEQYAEVTIANCTLDEWGEIVGKAVEQAKAGDSRARDFLARYLLPPAAMDLRLLMAGKIESTEGGRPIVEPKILAEAFAELEAIGMIQLTDRWYNREAEDDSLDHDGTFAPPIDEQDRPFTRDKEQL